MSTDFSPADDQSEDRATDSDGSYAGSGGYNSASADGGTDEDSAADGESQGSASNANPNPQGDRPGYHAGGVGAESDW